MFNVISTERNVKGNVCKMLYNHFEFLNKQWKKKTNMIRDMKIIGISVKRTEKKHVNDVFSE